VKLDKIKVYTIEIILLIILSFTLFVSNTYSKIILACLLTMCTVTTSILLKKRNLQSVYSKKINLMLLIFAIIYLLGFYAMGLYFGFYRPLITFSYDTIIQYIIPITIIIISSEMLRNILIAQNVKLTKVITFIIMVIIDLLIYSNINHIDGYDEIIEMIGFIFFASVACNLLYNYISVRYGVIGNIIYRLITVLYAYIIPVIPDLFIFFRSILRMVYPYIIYQILEYTFAKENEAVAYEDKRKATISKIIFASILAAIVMIVSCQFRYGLLVIGSGSMTGTINMGDAIFFEKYQENEVIELGQIIIFNKENIHVVHRVIDIKTVNGETRYITKGDANEQIDEGYITTKDIYGTTKFRIPYIGYGTIWMRDILGS